MDLTTVATSVGGAPEAAQRTWEIATPAPGAPRTYFQTILYIRLDTTGVIDGLAVDAGASTFAGNFLPLNYDALHHQTIPAAVLSASHDAQAVVVGLDGPRQVLEVKTSPPGRAVELRRVDGQVQADKSPGSAVFIDVRFAVQPTDGLPLAPGQLTQLQVQGQPTNTRIGIAAPGATDIRVFWPAPATAGQTSVDAGPDFARALADHLDTRWSAALALARQKPPAPLPGSLDVALVIQSDAPCRFDISSFRIVVRRRLESFPDGAEKRVLRFSGQRVEQQTVPLALPITAQIASAALRAVESFRPDRAVPAAGESIEDSVPAGDRGITLAAPTPLWAAQSFTPATAIQLSRIALALVPLAAGCELLVKVLESAGGATPGRELATARLSLASAGVRQWAVGAFPQPVTVSSQPHWILATAVKSAAVWLTQAGTEAVQILEQAGAGFQQRVALEGQQVLYQLLSPQAAATDSGQPVPAPARLFAGTQEIAGVAAPDGSRTYELTPALNALLQSLRTAAPPAPPVALQASATAAGILTIYPPRILYDVQSVT